MPWVQVMQVWVYRFFRLTLQIWSLTFKKVCTSTTAEANQHISTSHGKFWSSHWKRCTFKSAACTNCKPIACIFATCAANFSLRSACSVIATITSSTSANPTVTFNCTFQPLPTMYVFRFKDLERIGVSFCNSSGTQFHINQGWWWWRAGSRIGRWEGTGDDGCVGTWTLRDTSCDAGAHRHRLPDRWWFSNVTLWPGVCLDLRFLRVTSVLGFLLLPPAMQICGKRVLWVM